MGTTPVVGKKLVRKVDVPSEAKKLPKIKIRSKAPETYQPKPRGPFFSFLGM